MLLGNSFRIAVFVACSTALAACGGLRKFPLTGDDGGTAGIGGSSAGVDAAAGRGGTGGVITTGGTTGAGGSIILFDGGGSDVAFDAGSNDAVFIDAAP